MGNFCVPATLGPETYCGQQGTCKVDTNTTSHCECLPGFTHSTAFFFRTPNCYQPDTFAMAFELLFGIMAMLVFMVCATTIAAQHRKKNKAITPSSSFPSWQLHILAIAFLLLMLCMITHRLEGETFGPGSLVWLWSSTETAVFGTMVLPTIMASHTNKIAADQRIQYTVLICTFIFTCMFAIVCIEFAIANSNYDDEIFAWNSYSQSLAAFVLTCAIQCFVIFVLVSLMKPTRNVKDNAELFGVVMMSIYAMCIACLRFGLGHLPNEIFLSLVLLGVFWSYVTWKAMMLSWKAW